MQQIIFETSPGFIVLCIAVGIGYALLLYTNKHPWTKALNWILLSLRGVLAFVLAFLLLGPIVKQLTNVYEKPVLVLVHDNSASIQEVTDTLTLRTLSEKITSLRESLTNTGYTVAQKDLNGSDINSVVNFTAATSDLQGALRKAANQFEGQSVAGVVLVSDGIYNSGISPLYSSYSFPVFTVGLGDTTQRQDIAFKDLVYNKIAYQGNKFPIRAEVLIKGYPNQNISISLMQSGKVLERQSKNSGTEQLLVVEFNPVAAEQGIQRYEVQVEVKSEERNVRNNRSTAFVEVVEGKKKILMVASAPHPDIKALRAVVERNPNYEFVLHIPGVQETESNYLQPQNIDLAIFHQAPDKRGRTRQLFQQFANSKTSLFLVTGQQSDLNVLTQLNMPLKFEQPPRQFDDVMPVINPAFSNFTISTESNSMFSGFPPVWVPFGKMIIPGSAIPLLFQKVGSLATEKPLLWVDLQDSRKVAIMLGDGFWQWRLHEFSKAENTEAFDDVVGKLIQFLSTTDDKSKFRSYPVKQQFSETEAVILESQVYNDIYEPVFGNTIDLELTDEAGKKFRYNYVTNLGNARYQIGGLKEGVYRYSSSTLINGKKEEVRGQFLVSAQDTELQNLTADFDVLRKLSASTGGLFYLASDIDKLKAELLKKEAQSIIHSEETYDPLLNLKWVFFILLFTVSVEWFLRKYFGSY
jgi:hypothetical protein